MFRRLFAFLLALLIALALPAGALAQEYSFKVDKEVVNVLWNADGTESIDYSFTFSPQPGSHAIDFVDVGMPNDNFDIGTASADVNGQTVGVSRSDYQGSGSGFAVVLGSQAIQPGQTGVVHVHVGRISQVLHEDSQDSKYASAVFSPTYFGSQYVVGSTDLTVTFHLPPGVQPDQPKYHTESSGPASAAPQAATDNEGRITYTWSSPSASASTQYTFGASFPKQYVPAESIVTAPAFDITGIIGAIGGCFGPLGCFAFFAFMFLGVPILSAIQGQRRKLQYIPPRIGIEGHGIKRGLTAVEAAILMEEPLDKVMTMILFGVIKKGAGRVISRDPLKVEAITPTPDGLHPYELDFLKAIQLDDNAARQKGLQDMMVALVKSVGEKMKGFSRKETQDYYKNIMEQAWAQVAGAQTPEVKGQVLDQNLEWTMLDRDYNDRSRRVFTGPIFMPMWWGNYDPGYHPFSTSGHSGGTTSMPTVSAGRGSTALPGADFAASVVGGVQAFSGKVLGNVNAFTSRVTNVTNPPPPPSTSGYRGGGGGHSCACACACAGCACACAGGGR